MALSQADSVVRFGWSSECASLLDLVSIALSLRCHHRHVILALVPDGTQMTVCIISAPAAHRGTLTIPFI